MYEGLLPIEVAVESSIKSTTPAIPAGLDDPAGVPADPLDDVLRQIIGGYFVLTDGQGSVSKWSEPAELLFGRPAARKSIAGDPAKG